jgi:cystathionine beta-lyase/cystathionine gamma-synthase
VATFLRSHRAVAHTHYPGFPEHPGHKIAKRQMRGFGGMVTIDVKGGEAAALRLCRSTRIFALAESLGGVESLIGYPWSMSHAAFSEEDRGAKGITQATVRLSVGIENVEDLCDDLGQALARAAS